MTNLESIFNKLSVREKKEALDFAMYLADKKQKPREKKKKYLKLNWAGALRDIKDKYTAIDLQHQAKAW